MSAAMRKYLRCAVERPKGGETWAASVVTAGALVDGFLALRRLLTNPATLLTDSSYAEVDQLNNIHLTTTDVKRR